MTELLNLNANLDMRRNIFLLLSNAGEGLLATEIKNFEFGHPS
jgi:hypothetical protein